MVVKNQADTCGRYHHLNHYAMFGGGYKSGAMRIMKNLIEKFGDRV